MHISRVTLNDYGRAEQLLKNLTQSSFDAILFYEALEQYLSPSESLVTAVELLRPGGFVLARSLRNLSDVFGRSGYSIQADEKVTVDEENTCFILKAYVDDPYEGDAAGRRTGITYEAPSAASSPHGNLIRNARVAIEKAASASASLEQILSESSAGEQPGAKTSALTNRIVDLEAQLLTSKASETRLRQNLESERSLRLKVKAALGIKEVLLARLAQSAAEYETAWTELYGELEGSKCHYEEVTSGLRASLDATRRERDSARENLTREINALKAQISDGHTYVASLLDQIASKAQALDAAHGALDAVRAASLADKATMQQYVADLRERSADLESTLRAQMAALAERERVMVEREGELRERLVEFERRLGEENRQLRERVADAERALATQTDAMITKMQLESAQISKLVDTVQSSRFWKFKRWLNRLRGRRSGM